MSVTPGVTARDRDIEVECLRRQGVWSNRLSDAKFLFISFFPLISFQDTTMSLHDQHHDSSSVSSANRPFSIDLSLELERQLDLESLPGTPSYNEQENHDSLDPHVLASIVTQLRQTISHISKERDDLLSLVASAHSYQAELQDSLQLMTEKCTNMEDELFDARRKMKDDEDTLAMLRIKVEESRYVLSIRLKSFSKLNRRTRRGLMRLQTENRRMSGSPMSIDLSRAGIPSFGGPASSKRASFTPLTGSSFTSLSNGRPNSHRRISSVSDSLFGSRDSSMAVPDYITTSPSPSGQQTFNLPDNASIHSIASLSARSSHPPVSTRGFSIFGRSGSPPKVEQSQSEPSRNPSTALELLNLRRELECLKEQLEETRHDLAESNEAREASETCVKVLRDFIGEHKVGEVSTPTATNNGFGTVKLPPPPTMTTGEEPDTHSARKPSVSTGGWGFKLWKVETPVKGASTATTPITPASTTSTSPPTALPVPAEPLSKKLGGFFSSRTNSVSSPITPSIQPLSKTSSQTSQQTLGDSAYHGSDTSSESVSVSDSLAEPISPTSEGQANVGVMDVIHTHTGSPELESVSGTDLNIGQVKGDSKQDAAGVVLA